MAHSGTCGTCSWTITDAGTLNIGSGTLDDYISSTTSWKKYASSIKAVSVGVRTSGTVVAGTSLQSMFQGCSNLKTFKITGAFDLTNTTNVWGMFYMCPNLISVDFTGVTNASHITNMAFMFAQCTSLKSLDLSMFTTANVTDMGSMFSHCDSLASLDISSFTTARLQKMDSMFYGCSSLKALNLSRFNTSAVTSASFLFMGCSSLEQLTLGSNFTLSNISDFKQMFGECRSLSSLNLRYLNTSNATSMELMFSGCAALTAITFGSNFKTNNVVSMSHMFQACASLQSINLSNWNTANAVNMGGMFYGCSSLTSLDLSSFNTAKVVTMTGMFNRCSALASLDISSFDTSLAFENSNMVSMFGECPNLITIILGSSFKSTSNTGFIDSNYSHAINLTNDIVIQSTYELSNLTSSEIAGTWRRTNSDIIFEASVKRTDSGQVSEMGDDATFTIHYSTPSSSTNTKTLYIYKKENTDSTYPTHSEVTQILSDASDTITITLSDVGTSAYNFKVELEYGEQTYIVFLSIDANMQLIIITPDGSISISLDESAGSGTEDGDLYAAILALGWRNEVLE